MVLYIIIIVRLPVYVIVNSDVVCSRFMNHSGNLVMILFDCQIDYVYYRIVGNFSGENVWRIYSF